MNNAVTNDWTQTELENFASAIKIAAAHPATAKYHGDNAFIGSIKAEHLPYSDRARFDAMLIAAHQSRLLRLRRADLVGAMDPALVASSEVRYMTAEFHFVAVG